MIKIPFFSYIKYFQNHRVDFLKAIENTISSGNLILGNQVHNFESSFSNFLGGDGYSVATNSGTDALILALRCLDIGYGDEVITVANTCVPTISAIRSVGAIPVFCDIEAESALIDIGKVPSLLTDKTKAVIPVHLYGNVVNVKKLKKIINNPDIFIVEDCAQSFGSRIDNEMAGTHGDVSAFSFYPTKNLGAFGDGGLCYTKNEVLFEKIKRMRNYGFNEQRISEIEGINSRMDEIQAAILNVKLKDIHNSLKRRSEIADYYLSNITDQSIILKKSRNIDHSYHLFVIKLKNRDKVIDHFIKNDIQTSIHYKIPIHMMPAYKFLGYGPNSLPNTEKISDQVLSIPLYPELEDKEIDRIIKVLNNF